MMNNRIYAFLLVPILSLSIAFSVNAAELVGVLTDQLGVTNNQATGGAGAIFRYAKDRLSPDDFAMVAKAVPEMDSLLNAAPQAEGLGGMVGNGLSALNSDAGGLGELAALAGPFNQLDLDLDMIGKFVPVILDYVQSTGGESTVNLLKGALQ